jgi:acetate---CoA ligase (ADP-forming)
LNLSTLFSPKSVAVIGASRKRGTIGAEIFHNLLRNDFQGILYPVNPMSDFVQGVKAYRKITDIPGPVDLAVIVIPKEYVVAAAKECAKKRVKAMVVITAGFKETGAEGIQREKKLVEICRKSGIRLVGPNCLGVLNSDPAVKLDATFAPTFPPPGNVAFLSQSGALGLTILDYAKDLGIGISDFVSVGNKADISGNDLISFWSSEDRTRVILLYLESFGNPEKFLKIAKEVSRKKPIVAVKSGRSVTGARAAASHTGSLAGSDSAVGALFDQTGVIRVDTVEELFDMAMLLAHQPLPKGKRVGILTNAGGPGILAADACEARGLEVRELRPLTQRQVAKHLVPEATVKNPVDMIASASPKQFEKVIPILLRDPSIDALFVIYVPPVVTSPLDVANAIVRGAENSKKPVLTCFMGTHGVPEGLRSLKKSNIPSYAFPEAAVAALARAADYAAWRTRKPGKIRKFSDMDFKRIRRIVSRRKGWLPPEECFELLKAARIPCMENYSARSDEEAVSIFRKLGAPLAMKIDSPEVLHKTEVGGVQLRLDSAADVQKAFRELVARAKRHVSAESIRGVVLQKMVEGGEEMAAGAVHERGSPPLVMFGTGGVGVELWRDVSFALCPASDAELSGMVRKIRGYPLLNGFRGRRKKDISAVERILFRLSYLLSAVPEIREADLNPIIVRDRGAGAWIVDARIRCEI